jgi:hypothetical protein
MGMTKAVPTVQPPDRGRVAGETVGVREMAEAKAIPTTLTTETVMAQVREVALTREARGTMEMETLMEMAAMTMMIMAMGTMPAA